MNKNMLKSVIASIFMLSLLVSAGPISAKENDRGDNKNNDHKQVTVKTVKNDVNVTNNNGWAWGRFFAPGQLKKNGLFDLAGFQQALRDFITNYRLTHGATTTPTPVPASVDTSAPVIGGLQVTAERVNATLHFTTNESANSVVYLSTSTPVDVSSTSVAVAGDMQKLNHAIVLSNLATSTTYHFVVKVTDAAGNSAYSNTGSFVTKAIVIPTDAAAPKISNVYAVVGTSSVAVNWVTNEPATSKIFYGTSTPVDVSASGALNVENTSLVTTHSLSLSGLATSTKYYFVLESKDAAGNIKHSVDYYVITAGM